MARTPAELAVEVTDDGTGLHGSGHHGHGLAIMRGGRHGWALRIGTVVNDAYDIGCQRRCRRSRRGL